MNNTYMEKVTAVLKQFQMPEYHEIPDVGLYLKQVVKYINDHLRPILDDPLTPSMVSNYVKQKLVPNPVHKMYNREQIALLFAISISKCVLSMDEIRFLLLISEKNYSIEYSYGKFRDYLETAVHHIAEGKDLIPAPPEHISEGRILLQNTVITISHKIYMDQYFYYSQQDGVRHCSQTVRDL